MATMFAGNYDGLRKRDTYNEIIDYLENRQEKIRYPNRMAKFIRNSPQLSNLLDGEGMGVAQLEEQQKNQMKEIMKEHAIRETASSSNGTAQEFRSVSEKSYSVQSSDAVRDYYDAMQDFNDQLSNVTSSHESSESEKQSSNKSLAQESLAQESLDNPGYSHPKHVEGVAQLGRYEEASSSSSDISNTPPAVEQSSSSSSNLMQTNRERELLDMSSKKKVPDLKEHARGMNIKITATRRREIIREIATKQLGSLSGAATKRINEMRALTSKRSESPYRN